MVSERTVEFPEKLRFLFSPYRYKVAWGGRCGGKSWSYARALLLIGVSRPIRWLCTREIQRSIRQSVHQLLADQIKELGLEDQYAVQQADIVGRNGTSFTFSGLSDQTASSIKSFEGFDGVWVEEGQTVSKKSWDILVPTIRKLGSEIWVSFNPDLDTDEAYLRFVANPPPDACVVKVNYSDNPWHTEVMERERKHAQASMPADDYKNIWLGECRVVSAGAVYQKEVQAVLETQRRRPVVYDPSLRVHTVWDLGWNDKTAIILVQRAGQELRILGYVEDSYRTLTDYVAELETLRYSWGKDWLPHDGAHKEYRTGQSAQEILQRQGRRVEIIPRMDVEAGIKAARMVFPRCFFDTTATTRLFECLKHYRRRVDKTTGEPSGPLHDEYADGADAFRYLAVVADRLSDNDKFLKPIKYKPSGVV